MPNKKRPGLRSRAFLRRFISDGAPEQPVFRKLGAHAPGVEQIGEEAAQRGAHEGVLLEVQLEPQAVKGALERLL